MPFASDHDSWADATGAYLLGALPADEREGFERHLGDCAFCREEVEFLRGAADALPRAVPQVAPPPELRSRIMAVVDREAELLHAAEGPSPAPAAPRRAEPWWRRLVLAPSRPALAAWALVLVLVLAGAAAGVLLAGGGGEQTRTLAGTGAAGAQVRLVVRDGQGRLEVDDMPQPPAGRIYEVWVKRPGRDPEPTSALFVPAADGTAVASVPGSLKGAEAVLVTDEPRGGSRTPTGSLAVNAPLRGA